MTLEQTQYLADNPQFHSPSVLSDGSMVVRVGTGNSMTKITSRMIQDNSNRHSAKNYFGESNQQGTNVEMQTLQNIDASKIKHMAEYVAKAEGKQIDVDSTVSEIKLNPQYYNQLHQRYSNAVMQEQVNERARRDVAKQAGIDSDRHKEYRAG